MKLISIKCDLLVLLGEGKLKFNYTSVQTTTKATTNEAELSESFSRLAS